MESEVSETNRKTDQKNQLTDLQALIFLTLFKIGDSISGISGRVRELLSKKEGE